MKTAYLVVLGALALWLSACGKFAPPIPPERLAPRAIEELQVTAQDTQMEFKWRAPRSDERGRELKSIDGYHVYRKIITQQSDISDPKARFELLASVPDTHIIEREKLRAEARAQGKPGRRIDAPAASKDFRYADGSVKPGESYLYKIVPYNQGDSEGLFDRQTLVLFSGTASKITVIGEDEQESDADTLEQYR